MIPENLETLNRSFAVQAPNFDSKSVNFTKKEYLDYTVDAASPAGTDIVLEIAAGTCACGRHLLLWFRPLYALTQQPPCSKSEKKKHMKAI